MDMKKNLVFMMIGLLLLAAMAGVSVAGTAPRGTPDNADSEPNGSTATATNITLASTNIPGTLTGIDDSDVYKIWLSNTGGSADTVTIIADFNTSNGVSIEITDASGFLYFQGFDNNADNKVVKIVSGYTQFYFINVSKQMGDVSYSLSINKVSGAYAGNVNNHPTNAQASSGDNQPVTSTLDQTTPTDHQDFFRITLSSTGAASDLLVVFLDQPDGTDFWVQLYKGTGPVYTFVKQGKAAQPGGNVTVTYGAQATGDIFIRIFAWSGAGQYKVYIQKTSINKDTSNGYSTATPITLTADHTWSGTGEVAEGIDAEDWYSLPIGKGQFINVTINSQDYSTVTKLPMIFVSLLRADHVSEYLDINKTDSQVDPIGYTNGTTPDSSGTNYIKVYALGGGGGGRYSLNLLTDKPPVIAGVVGTINILENSVNSSVNLATLFDDPDASDTLVYSYEKGDGTVGYKDNTNLTVSIALDGKVTVTPKPGTPRGWTGSGGLTFKARDPYGMNATGTYTVNVKGANHAPYVMAPYNATMSLVDSVLLTYGDVERNGTIDLKSIFADNDTGDKLKFEVYTADSLWIQKDYSMVLGQQVLNGATVNDSFRISFTKEANLVDHKGPINIYITDTAKTSKKDHDAVVFFEARDNGDPPMASQRIKVTLMIRKASGNPPEWKSTLTKVQFNEDNSTTINLDDYTTDVDSADSDALIYDVSDYGNNLTVTKVDRSHYKFSAKQDWFGEVNNVKAMVTDTFGLTANQTFKVAVISVPDAPVEDPVKNSPGTIGPVVVDENSIVNFTVGVKDPDSLLTELIYEWKFDNVVVSTAVGDTFQYKPNFDAAGQHTVVVKVTDNEVGSHSFTVTWNVTVNNVNRAPTSVKIIAPVKNATYKEGAKIACNAQAASDPDKDTLSYTWYMDGTQLPGGNVQSFTVTKVKPGKHTIKLTVSDGKTSVSDEVSITVKKKVVAGFIPGFEAVLIIVAMAAVVVVALKKKR